MAVSGVTKRTDFYIDAQFRALVLLEEILERIFDGGAALLLRSRDMPNNSKKVMPINSESDRLWELSCVFFLVDILRVAHTNPIRTCRALSETKVSTSWLSPMESDNLSDKKERKIIPKLTSATHVLPVVTFPLSLGFAAGNLE
jgi:hypothetical protein